jgi:hypothetical protein
MATPANKEVFFCVGTSDFFFRLICMIGLMVIVPGTALFELPRQLFLKIEWRYCCQ